MTGAEHGSAPPATLDVTPYELLRRAALGEMLPPEARTGLTLFLRRGMWGWARAMATTRASSATTPGGSFSKAMAPAPDAAIIHVFAALVIPTDTRGARL